VLSKHQLESWNILPNTIDEDFILSHYLSTTCFTLATDTVTIELWQTAIPKLAQEFTFLKYGVLACAALHLSYSDTTREQEYFIIANKYQNIATPLYRLELEIVNGHNCDAIFAFSHLLSIYAFASSKHDGRLLLAENNQIDVLPSWLYFMRTGCLMLCDVWDRLEDGPVKGLAQAWEEPMAIIEKEATSPPHPLLYHLLSIIPDSTSVVAWAEETCQIYRNAALELSRAFSFTHFMGKDLTTWHALRVWPMRVPVEYINLLSSWHPGALILLAHYCIILQKLEDNWYFEGTATSLLTMILTCLDETWHKFIVWRLEDLESPSPNGWSTEGYE